MAQVNYSTTSPYFSTQKFGNFLDVMINRSITKYPDDVLYSIDKVYEYRGEN